MPRKKRIWYEGARYHIMARGNRRGKLFHDEEDYALFMNLLELSKERYPFILHSYCLMTNHFHLEISTLKDPVWKIMQPVMSNYSRNYNRKYKYLGHLFESRYTSSLIENPIYFLEVSRYIHLNPVKAKMVEEPLDYRFSSYRFYVTDEINPLLETSQILNTLEKSTKEQYQKFVEERLSHEEEDLMIQKEINEDILWLPDD